MITITQNQITIIEGLRKILKSGYYADSTQVTDTYNEVFNTRLSVTNCGSCIRQRMQALVAALDQFYAKIAKADQEETNLKNEEDHGTDGHTQSPSPTTKAKRKGKQA